MFNKLRRQFSDYGNKNIDVYYSAAIFDGTWLLLPNWVFYFAQYISRQQIGVLDALAIAFGMIMEVPTGAISDLFGKKNTLILGRIAMILAFIITGLGFSFTTFLIGTMLLFLGYAFRSGALEAFAYDSMLGKGQEEHYDEAISNFSFLSTLSMFILMLCGGGLFALNPRLPWFVAALIEVLGLFSLAFANEPAVDSLKFSLRNYFRQTKEGFMHLFNVKLLEFLGPVLVLVGVMGMTQGVVRQSTAEYFGYSGETFSYLLAAVNILAALAILQYKRIKKLFSEMGFLQVLLLMYLAAMLIAIFRPVNFLLAGGIAFFIKTTVDKFMVAHNSTIFNQRIESKYRATTLSSLSLLGQIPYVFVMLFFTWIVEIENLPLLFWAICSLVTLGLGLSLIRSNKDGKLHKREN